MGSRSFCFLAVISYQTVIWKFLRHSRWGEFLRLELTVSAKMVDDDYDDDVDDEKVQTFSWKMLMTFPTLLS